MRQFIMTAEEQNRLWIDQPAPSNLKRNWGRD
jgi:hypothetical protein